MWSMQMLHMYVILMQMKIVRYASNYFFNYQLRKPTNEYVA
jgi:hypothetical protein